MSVNFTDLDFLATLPKSRAEARVAGKVLDAVGKWRLVKSHYFTGKLCQFGHIAARLTSSVDCCECVRTTFKDRTQATHKRHMQTEKGKATYQRAIVRFRDTDKSKTSVARSVAKKPDLYKAAACRRKSKRYHSDHLFRLVFTLRERIRNAFKSQHHKKLLPTSVLVGCSILELQSWLLFLSNWTAPGATLENYGQWQIDHKIAVGRWDFKCPLQQYLCNHWTNLQPLWITDHLVKSKADVLLMKYANQS